MSEENGRPVELQIVTVDTVEYDNLPLTTSFAYGERHVSEAMNMATAGIVSPGFYSGFTPSPNGDLNVLLSVDADIGIGTAVVQVGKFQLKVFQNSDISIEMVTGRMNTIVLEGSYEHGVITTQVSADSVIEPATLTCVAYDDVTDDQLIVCDINLTGGELIVEDWMIDLSRRPTSDLNVAAHEDKEDPHPQYNPKQTFNIVDTNDVVLSTTCINLVVTDFNSQLHSLEDGTVITIELGDNIDARDGTVILTPPDGEVIVNNGVTGSSLKIQRTITTLFRKEGQWCVYNTTAVLAEPAEEDGSLSAHDDYASTLMRGMVQLMDGVSSTSLTMAPTANALRLVQVNAETKIAKTSISDSIDSEDKETVGSSFALSLINDNVNTSIDAAKDYTDSIYDKIMGTNPQELLDSMTEIAEWIDNGEDVYAALLLVVDSKIAKTSISSSVTSTSITTVASSAGLKLAYDLAASKMTQSSGDERYLGINDTADNSDLLGGVAASQFLRSDVSDIMTAGGIRFNDNVYITLGNDSDIEHFFTGTNYYTDINSGDWIIREGTTTRFTFDLSAGNLTATTFTGALAGNATTATKLASDRTITYTGGATGSFTFDGASDETCALTVQDDSHDHSNYMEGFVVQDGDGTNVTVNNGDYIKFVEGGNIDINFTDTNGGGSSDPFDLSFTVATGSTSVKGVIQLSTSVSSTSTTLGATSSAARLAYVLAASKMTQSTANTLYLGIDDTADNSLLLGGLASSSFLRSNAADIKSAGYLRFNDSIVLSLGSGTDVEHFFNGSNYYTDVNVGDWYIRDGTTTRFTFDTSAGILYATGNIGITSDIRRKENITQLEDVLANLRYIRGYSYDRIDLPQLGRQIGVISQRVQERLPELVMVDKEGWQSVNYSGLTAVAIEGINILDENATKAKRRLSKAESKIRVLTNIVKRLTAKFEELLSVVTDLKA